MDYAGNVARFHGFSEVLFKCSNTLFASASVTAGSEIMENGLLSRRPAKETITGGSQMDFTDELL